MSDWHCEKNRYLPGKTGIIYTNICCNSPFLNGQAMKRRMREEEPESIIPKDIQEVFDEVDIEKTWDYLEKTFHLNRTKWKGLFEEQFSKSSRQYNKVELFVRFGKQHLEEPICKIIYRDQFYSRTWMGLIRFIVKHKIAEKEKEAAADKAKYGVSSRYKINNPKY